MNKTVTPQKALQHWARARKLTPARLSVLCQFTYDHTWSIMRGHRPITEKTIGHLLVVLGADGPAIAMADAMNAQQRKNGNGHKALVN